MASKLTTLAQQKSSADIQTMSRESMKWLEKKMVEIRNPTQIRTGIRDEKSRQTSRFKLGGLYCFYYSAKGRQTLPYYDRFPLVLALEKYSDGFLGLNLHYLPLKYRLAFLDKLMDFAVLDSNDDIKRMHVTYDILNASRRFREFRPCIKRYLLNQVQSKILTIQPNEWDIAAYLPIHMFAGAPATQVWQESLEEIRNH